MQGGFAAACELRLDVERCARSPVSESDLPAGGARRAAARAASAWRHGMAAAQRAGMEGVSAGRRRADAADVANRSVGYVLQRGSKQKSLMYVI